MDHFIDYHQFKSIKTNTKDRLNISLLCSISVAVVIRSKDKETVTVAKIMDAVFMSKNSLKFTLNKIMADFNEKSQNGIKDANIMVFGGDTVTHFRTLLVLNILNSSMNFQAFVGNPLSSKTINYKKNQFLNLIVGRDIKLVKGFVISSDRETIKKVLENGISPVFSSINSELERGLIISRNELKSSMIQIEKHFDNKFSQQYRNLSALSIHSDLSVGMRADSAIQIDTSDVMAVVSQLSVAAGDSTAEGVGFGAGAAIGKGSGTSPLARRVRSPAEPGTAAASPHVPSEPSPMAFVLNTPTQDVAGSASDAGGSAIAPSVSLSQLNAAQATIAELHGLLGAARAELKAVVDAQQAAQDTRIKLAVLEAKLEMQASLGALQAER